MTAPSFQTKLPLPVFFFTAAVYVVCLFSLIRQDGIWVNDEGSRILQIKAFAAGSHVLRDPLQGAFLPGLMPYAADDYFVRDPKSGGIISGYTEAFPRCMAGLYRIGGFPLIRATVIAFALLCLCMTALTARLLKFSPAYTAGVIILTGVGTPLLFYAGTVLEITLAAFLFSLFLYTAVLAVRRRNDLRIWAAAGFLLALIPWFREEAYMIFAGFFAGLLFLRSGWKAPAVFAGVFLVCASPLWISNYLSWGSPFGLHYLIYREIVTEPVTIFTRCRSFYFFLFGSQGFGLWDTVLAAICFLAMFFGLLKDDKKIRLQIKGILCVILAAVSILNLYFLLSTPEPVFDTLGHQSICGTVPFFLIPFLFARSFLTDPWKIWRFLFISGILAAFGIAGCLEYESRGIFFGPRYHNLILPLFALLAWRSFHYLSPAEPVIRRIALCACILLFCAGICCQFEGLRLLKSRKAWSQEINEFCRKLPAGSLLLTNVFYMPEELSFQDDSLIILHIKKHGLPSLEFFTKQLQIKQFFFLTKRDRSGLLPDLSGKWNIAPVRDFTNPDLRFMNMRLYMLDRKAVQ